MKKAAGIISLIGCCIGIVSCLLVLSIMYDNLMELYERGLNEDIYDQGVRLKEAARIQSIMRREIPIVLLFIISFAVGIYYILVTRFGSIESAILQQLERENNLIRKQIEKRELLVKLENLEKK